MIKNLKKHIIHNIRVTKLLLVVILDITAIVYMQVNNIIKRYLDKKAIKHIIKLKNKVVTCCVQITTKLKLLRTDYLFQEKLKHTSWLLCYNIFLRVLLCGESAGVAEALFGIELIEAANKANGVQGEIEEATAWMSNIEASKAVDKGNNYYYPDQHIEKKLPGDMYILDKDNNEIIESVEFKYITLGTKESDSPTKLELLKKSLYHSHSRLICGTANASVWPYLVDRVEWVNTVDKSDALLKEVQDCENRQYLIDKYKIKELKRIGSERVFDKELIRSQWNARFKNTDLESYLPLDRFDTAKKLRKAMFLNTSIDNVLQKQIDLDIFNVSKKVKGEERNRDILQMIDTRQITSRSYLFNNKKLECLNLSNVTWRSGVEANQVFFKSLDISKKLTTFMKKIK